MVRKESYRRISTLPRPPVEIRKIFFPSYDYILNSPYRSEAFWNVVSPSDVLEDDNMLWYETQSRRVEGLKCYRWIKGFKLYSSGLVGVVDKNGKSMDVEIRTVHYSDQAAALNIASEFESYGFKGLDIKPVVLKNGNLDVEDFEQSNCLFSVSYHKSEREKALFLLDFYTKYSYMLGLEPVWENDIFECTSFPGYAHKIR